MTEHPLKPSARRVLNRLRQGPSTTHDLMQADVGGVRFGARLRELRELGATISEDRLPLPARGSLYRLTHDPERALSETQELGSREQASPGSVPSSEGVRLAASAQDDSLFDSSAFESRAGYRDAA